MATYVMIILQIKLLEYFRALDVTSLYARLILQTFQDMRYFLLILIAVIVFSSITIFIFDSNAIERGSGELENFLPGHLARHGLSRFFNTLFT